MSSQGQGQTLLHERVLQWRRSVKLRIVGMVGADPGIRITAVRKVIVRAYGLSHRRFNIYIRELLDDEEIFQDDNETLSQIPFETYTKLAPMNDEMR